MRNVAAICRRNLKLFFRDPLNAFFSLLGALIVFGIYALFLGNMQVTQIQSQIPGSTMSDVKAFVDAWMFAGIVAMATMSTTLGALSVFVEDSASGRFSDFLVSPLTRRQLVLGYIFSAFVVGMIMTLIVFVVSLAYLAVFNSVILSVSQILLSLLWIVLSTAGFTALWSFVVSFVKTTGSFSAVSTVAGTAIGFVAGAYIAIGQFPAGVQNVVSALPFAQSAMLFRMEFATDPLNKLAGGNQEAITDLNSMFGITLSVGDQHVTALFAAAVLVAMVIIFSGLAARRIRSRIG